jgi:hypothetical protein
VDDHECAWGEYFSVSFLNPSFPDGWSPNPCTEELEEYQERCFPTWRD